MIEKQSIPTIHNNTIYSITAERDENGTLQNSVVVNIPGYNENQKEYLTNIRELTKMLGGVDIRESPESLNVRDIHNFVRDDIVLISDMYIYGAIVFGASVSLPDDEYISSLYFNWKQSNKLLALNNDKEYRSILERFLISSENIDWYDAIQKLSDELQEKNIKIPIDEFDRIVELNNDQIETYEIIVGDDFVQYGDFTQKIPKDRLDLLKKKGTSQQIVEMSVYYASLLSSGQQWSVSQDIYDGYYHQYGITLEAFASPLNQRLMKFNTPFCSINFDTDSYFGSKGSIFEYSPREGELIMANPPFIESIMDKFVTHIDFWMKEIISLGIIFVGPDWSDSSFYIRLNTPNKNYNVSIQDYTGNLSKIVDNKIIEFKPNFGLKIWFIEKIK